MKALGQRAIVGEVVERGQQFAAREIAGGSEDDERRRGHRQALETRRERVLGLGERCGLLAGDAHLLTSLLTKLGHGPRLGHGSCRPS